MDSQAKNTEIWLKSAVVGGLWASMEIILGSFLHNTRIPMAGTTLAFMATILLTGYYTIWPVKGMIIRAGLIAALMKSVSPSAIILGPMTGIMLEAILVELALSVFGKNIISYIIAGVLSLSSALFHKLISLVIFYGSDLIKVYVNIVNFGLKQLRVSEAQPESILLFLLIFYIVSGTLAGVAGFFLGKKAIEESKGKSGSIINLNKSQSTEFFIIGKEQKTSVIQLIINIIGIISGLVLINTTWKPIGFIFIITLSIVLTIKYRKQLRRLRKPVFWVQLIFIVILSAFFWGDDGNKILGMNEEGLMAGAEMIVRAIFIVISFTGISVELKNEKVRDLLMRIGLGNFYKSISVSFASLPAIISMLPASKEIFLHPVSALIKPVSMANQWLKIFRTKFEEQINNE